MCLIIRYIAFLCNFVWWNRENYLSLQLFRLLQKHGCAEAMESNHLYINVKM